MAASLPDWSPRRCCYLCSSGALPVPRLPSVAGRLHLEEWLPPVPPAWYPARKAPPTLRGGRSRRFAAVPAVGDATQQAWSAREWLWAAWQWLKGLLHWWPRILALSLSAGMLAALRLGLLPRVHDLMLKFTTYILREPPKTTRSYRQSFLFAAEAPLMYFCFLNILCRAVATCAQLFLQSGTAKSVIQYCNVIIELSGKVGLGWLFYRLVNQKIARSSRGLAQKSDILGAETSRQEAQVLAVGQTSRVIVVLCTVLSCLPLFHVDIGTLLSFCGAGGLAISLVSKGVFVNLIGSLTLYLTQPFTLGDWIQSVDGELDGWVQSMGPYHTVLMRWDRRPVYIPNSRFVNKQIVNASRMTNRRILMDVPVRIADLDKVDGILYDMTELITTHKAVSTEMHRIVRLRKIERHAAMIWVSCYTTGINLKEYVDAREDILLEIKNIMFKHGTTFASTLERTGVGIWGGAEDTLQSSVSAPASSEVDTTQRPQLATELQRLKQLQVTLWERERELRGTAQSLTAQRASLLEEQGRLEERRRRADAEDATVRINLDELAGLEAKLRYQEESAEASLDDLQVREDALDQVMRELLQKDLQDDSYGLSSQIVAKQQARKESVEQADRVIEIHQELLLQEKKALEQEREMLQAEMQGSQPQIEEADEIEEETEIVEDEGTAAEEVTEEESELTEAARTQKIAESLGGE